VLLCHHNPLHKHNLHGHPPPSVGASVSTIVGETMAMPVSTEMGVTAFTTTPTITTAMTQPKIGTFVPSITAGVPMSTSIPVSPNPQFEGEKNTRRRRG